MDYRPSPAQLAHPLMHISMEALPRSMVQPMFGQRLIFYNLMPLILVWSISKETFLKVCWRLGFYDKSGNFFQVTQIGLIKKGEVKNHIPLFFLLKLQHVFKSGVHVEYRG